MDSQGNQSKITSMAQEIDGCMCVFFSGYDGMIIFKHETMMQTTIDPDYVAANFVSVLKNLSSEENGLTDILASFKSNIIAIHVMEDGFFGVIMSQDGNIGRAKLELKKLGRRFL